MSINLSGYYDYLNTLSSSVTQNINSVDISNYGISADGNSITGEQSASFESALLSMIQQSNDVSQAVNQANEQGTPPISAADTASELYNELTNILDSYHSMSASFPKSIKESLFQSLMGSEEAALQEKAPSNPSELNLGELIQKVSSSL